MLSIDVFNAMTASEPVGSLGILSRCAVSELAFSLIGCFDQAVDEELEDTNYHPDSSTQLSGMVVGWSLETGGFTFGGEAKLADLVNGSSNPNEQQSKHNGETGSSSSKAQRRQVPLKSAFAGLFTGAASPNDQQQQERHPGLVGPTADASVNEAIAAPAHTPPIAEPEPPCLLEARFTLTWHLYDPTFAFQFITDDPVEYAARSVTVYGVCTRSCRRRSSSSSTSYDHSTLRLSPQTANPEPETQAEFSLTSIALRDGGPGCMSP